MTYTFDDNIYSDLYKEANGFRPGQSGMEWWNSLDDDGKQKQWDSLLEDLDDEIKRQEQYEREAIESFEAAVSNNIELGAADRAEAIRWMIQAGGWEREFDPGYICYCLGLPYHKGYEEEFLPHIRTPDEVEAELEFDNA